MDSSRKRHMVMVVVIGTIIHRVAVCVSQVWEVGRFCSGCTHMGQNGLVIYGRNELPMCLHTVST